MFKVLITTVPFANKNKLPVDLLKRAGIEYLINPLNKKLTEDELIKMVSDYDAIIAGTETISKKVLDSAKKLKHISRVGIGLDSVDLIETKKRGIKVSYTPDAPAPAVAELTIGMMLSLLRSTHVSNLKMHRGEWSRIFGRRLSNVTVGIIGVGRIGTGVIKHLQSFGSPSILANDLQDKSSQLKFPISWVEKNHIIETADIVSLHLPLTSLTKNLINKKQLLSMKKDAMIINTSRGGIVNEADLYSVMQSGHLSGAAIDVFDQEPYKGQLAKIDKCLLSSHMGSMSVDCRARMEIEATEEVIRFYSEKPLQSPVPIEEYNVQKMDL